MTARPKGAYLLAFILTFLLGFGLAVWLLLFEGKEEETVPSPQREREIESTEYATISRTAGQTQKETLKTTESYLAGIVIDKVTEEPLDTFHLRIKRKEGEWRSSEIARDDVSDSEGRFAYPLEEGGRFVLFVKAPGYVSTKVDDIYVPPFESPTDLVIALEPVRSISGRVVDGSTGLPVEGAFVVAGRLGYQEAAGFDGSADTDEAGWFTLEGLRDETYRVTACHTDYEEGFVEAGPGGGEILIRLKNAYFHIVGTAFDDDGRPRPDVDIVIWCPDLPEGQPNMFKAKTDENGYYSSPPLSPGPAEVTARVFPWRKGSSPFTDEFKRVVIVDRDVELNFGLSEGYAVWRGTLYDWDGIPVPHAYICLRLNWAKDSLDPPPVILDAQCDRDGRFAVKKLVPGRYQLSVEFPKDHEAYACFGNYECDPVSFDAPRVFQKDIRLPGGEIRGVVLPPHGSDPQGMDDYFVGRVIATHSSGRFFSVYFYENGRFSLKGLPPGDYTLSAKKVDHATAHGGRVRLERNQVVEDVRIVLPATGRAKIIISGLNPSTPPLRFDFRRLDGGASRPGFSSNFYSGSKWYYCYHLEKGSWILTLDHEELGRLERHFEVYAEKTTKITLRAEEFPLK